MTAPTRNGRSRGFVVWWGMLTLMMKMKNCVGLILLAASTARASSCGTAPGSLVEITHDLVIAVCADGVFRVLRTPPSGSTHANAALQKKKSLMVDPSFPAVGSVPKFSVSNSSGKITIATARLRAVVDATAPHAVSFTSTTSDKALLHELGHAFTPTQDPAKPGLETYIVEQRFSADEGEGLYGGGEFQNGMVQYRGVPIEIVQFNTEAAVPFFSSTKGHGLLWDSNAWTYLNPPTSKPLNFTPSPKPFPVTDGTGILLAPCNAGEFAQGWIYHPSDLRLAFNGSTTAVLDCDGCNVGHAPHLWHSDKGYSANQQWTFTSEGQLQSTQHKDACLGVAHTLSGRSSRGSASGHPAVQMEACSGGKARWKLDQSTGLLALVSSSASSRQQEGQQQGGMCLAAGSSRRVGTFTPSESGDHSFFLDMCHGFGCGFGREVYLTLTDPAGGSGATQTIQEWDKLTNLPDSLAGAARGLRAGVTYTLSLISPFEEATASGTGAGGQQQQQQQQQPSSSSVSSSAAEKIYVVGPTDAKRTVLRSQLGTSIDYYLTYTSGDGASLDGAIAGYRTVTGTAPLYGRWAYGFWQCKEHYQHQAELLGAAKRFRDLSIPLDAIVQDWHYWGDLGWGPHWDHKYYPDPAGMVSNLTASHLKLMVSVWSKFDKSTNFHKEMSAKGYMLNGTDYYDVWSDGARELFYSYSKASMFSIGVESLWLDATEPENFPNVDHKCSADSDGIGSGNLLMNSYSLKTTQAIADGLRRDYATAQGRRVFSLTRSSFAGQQRNGAALWSGDISSTWDSLRRQVAASLNYQASGIPYWSEDIGGFFRPSNAHTDPKYHTLLTRWFQFGAFTPIFRVHGSGDGGTELWLFGNTTMANIVHSAIKLRYALLPYTYSGFARVMLEHTTMQRLLAFDWPDDPNALTIADQFMWGKTLMVAPVLEEDALSRNVYLPKTASSNKNGWYRFWDGTSVEGGQTYMNVSAPLLEIPLYARGGSILLVGPPLQYVDEKAADPLEVRVYDGADCTFTLYEDDGVSDFKDGGAASMIDFEWKDASSTLSLSAYRGKGFPGRLATRSFHLVRVRSGHGVGYVQTAKPDKVIVYDGKAQNATLPKV